VGPKPDIAQSGQLFGYPLMEHLNQRHPLIALRVKIREDAVLRNKAMNLALGVLPDGSRDILGLWIEGAEGAKFG